MTGGLSSLVRKGSGEGDGTFFVSSQAIPRRAVGCQSSTFFIASW